MDDLARRLKNGASVTVFDVRGPDEFAGPLGHIKDALNLPVGELPNRLTEIKALKNRPIILVCRTVKRSTDAAVFLHDAGFQDVRVLRGGMEEWKQSPRSRTGCGNPDRGKELMKSVFILNDPPYGTERCYNALRLVNALIKKDAEAWRYRVPDSRRCDRRKGGSEDSGRLLQHGADVEACALRQGTGAAVRDLHGCARPY